MITLINKQKYQKTVDKVYYHQMLDTYRNVQLHNLEDLSKYAMELNNIFQKELHQNIDLVNFSNEILFQTENDIKKEEEMVESVIITEDDT